MNFSIVVAGGCNAKCKFCFWKQTKECENYIARIESVLKNLPEGLALSLTGGEPTLSPYFNDIIKSIKKYKNKFQQVILTSNGSNLYKYLDTIDGVIDHINISRHHYDEKTRNDIFGAEISPDYYLKPLIENINQLGIDVTFNSVLSGDLKTKEDVLNFIKYSKGMGASAICFRKDYNSDATLKVSNIENEFDNYKHTYEYNCPVCRTKIQYVNGMKISWKSSAFEPSIELKDIYELVLHPNGKLTVDWEGKHEIQIYNGVVIDGSRLVRTALNMTEKKIEKIKVNTNIFSDCGSTTIKPRNYSGCGSVNTSRHSGCGSVNTSRHSGCGG